MYSYDRAKVADARQLRVVKTAPIEFIYEHPEHGSVRIGYNGEKWVLITPTHKVRPLQLAAGPGIADKPQFQKMLMDQADQVLATL